MPEIEIFPNFALNIRKFSPLVKKLAKQNLGLFSVMAAERPNQTVKNGIIWRTTSIQIVKVDQNSFQHYPRRKF